MKYIISESKLQDVALAWMTNNYGLDKLESVTDHDYPDSIFFRKDGKVVMEQDSEFKIFWFHEKEIWLFFKEFFGIYGSEMRDLMSIWLEQTFNLKGYKPEMMKFPSVYGWNVNSI